MKLRGQRESWEEIGEKDPLWGVLSDPSMKNNRWDVDEFFNTGKVEIDELIKEVSEVADFTKRGRALDFGSGVGRLTRRLSKYFDRVTGVDISSSMIEKARRFNADYKNCSFVQNTRTDLKDFDSGAFDFIYTNITLQHIPRKFIINYLAEFCRLLSRGGVLAFQLPSHCTLSLRGAVFFLAPNFLLNFLRRRRYKMRAVIEMHTLPRRRVETILKNNKMDIRRVSPCDFAGQGFASYKYIAVKE
ncbi:MAG: class I SAM-dependent methyltransferase [Desulfobacterales bacterium]|nr:class I SAM-dependent methyltransferase [Desulfobacterales bacterium]